MYSTWVHLPKYCFEVIMQLNAFLQQILEIQSVTSLDLFDIVIDFDY